MNNNSNIPNLGNNIEVRPFSILYLFLIWFAVYPTLVIASIFFQYFLVYFHFLILLMILPLLILFYYLLFYGFLLLACKLVLILFNLIRTAREGIFERDFSDIDYLFFCLRKSIKTFLFKMANYFPLPWIRILAYKLCGIKVSTSTALLDSYIDIDFIEFGEDTILGEGSVILSSMVVGKFLVIKKVILESATTIGAFCVIAPGTILGKGSILGGGSFTGICQHLEPGWIYVGRPAKKMKKIIPEEI